MLASWRDRGTRWRGVHIAERAVQLAAAGIAHRQRTRHRVGPAVHRMVERVGTGRLLYLLARHNSTRRPGRSCRGTIVSGRYGNAQRNVSPCAAGDVMRSARLSQPRGEHEKDHRTTLSQSIGGRWGEFNSFKNRVDDGASMRYGHCDTSTSASSLALADQGSQARLDLARAHPACVRGSARNASWNRWPTSALSWRECARGDPRAQAEARRKELQIRSWKPSDIAPDSE